MVPNGRQTIQNRIYIINSSLVTIADTKHPNVYNIAQKPFISSEYGKCAQEIETMQTTH